MNSLFRYKESHFLRLDSIISVLHSSVCQLSSCFSLSNFSWSCCSNNVDEFGWPKIDQRKNSFSEAESKIVVVQNGANFAGFSRLDTLELYLSFHLCLHSCVLFLGSTGQHTNNAQTFPESKSKKSERR